MYYRKIWADRSGVSPIVATILLVGITVILVGLIYLWVSGWIVTPKETTTTAEAGSYYDEEWGYFVVIINSIEGDAPGIGAVDYRIIDAGGGRLTDGNLEDIYGIPFPPINEITFLDEPADSKLNQNDRLLINETVEQYNLKNNGGSLVLAYSATHDIILEVTLTA